MLIEEILSYNPDVVGFTALTYNFNYSKQIARKIKEKSKKDVITIFGGYHISALPEEVKDDAIDFGVIGEGEITALELINTINKNLDLKNVTGICYFDKRKKQVIITRPRERIKNLDELPWPKREAKFIEGAHTTQIGYPTPPK